MSNIFRVTPKRIIRRNGLVLTPEMSIVVTMHTHSSTPFNNGAEEVKRAIYAHVRFRLQESMLLWQ